MKINIYATFRQVVGARSIDLDVPEQTAVQDMLETICSAYPQLCNMLLDDSGQLLGHIHIFINGRDIQYLPDGMRTLLTAADKIDIFPPIAGGTGIPAAV